MQYLLNILIMHRNSHNQLDRPTLRSALLAWYAEEKRDLPWRSEPSLYKTVVSEFMLQQTQIKTALPYFHRWLKRFPDFETLAGAKTETVLKYWEGLGYYNRARNLQKLAGAMVAMENEPDSLEAWQALPGVGPYTAAAIASIAQDTPAAVVDGNVVRVLARLSAHSKSFAGNGAAVTFFRPLANALLDPKAPGDFNQAMMELGATVCTKAKPQCECCPLNSVCRGYALAESGKGSPVTELPKIQRAVRTKLRIDRGIALRDGTLLLKKIASNAQRLSDHFEIPDLAQLALSAKSDGLDLITVRRRAISNQSIEERLYRIAEDTNLDAAEASEAPFYWIDLQKIPSILLSGPHRRWLTDYLNSL